MFHDRLGTMNTCYRERIRTTRLLLATTRPAGVAINKQPSENGMRIIGFCFGIWRGYKGFKTRRSSMAQPQRP